MTEQIKIMRRLTNKNNEKTKQRTQHYYNCNFFANSKLNILQKIEKLLKKLKEQVGLGQEAYEINAGCGMSSNIQLEPIL